MVLSICFVLWLIKIRYYRSKDIKKKGNNNFKKEERYKEWLLGSKGCGEEGFMIRREWWSWVGRGKRGYGVK